MQLQQPDEPKRPKTISERITGIVLSLAVVVVVVVGYWFILPMISEMGGPPDAHAGVGLPLSLLELHPLTGDAPPISLADLKGHVTLLNFWGTWCPPCCVELPHLAELRQRYAGQKAFRLVAVSCPTVGQAGDVQLLHDETTATLKQMGINMPTYRDPNYATQEALMKLIVSEGYYPTTVLLDRRGVIRAVWLGYRPGREIEMERYVNKILDEEHK